MKTPKFKTAHLWLLIPLVIFLSGFYYTYWRVFPEVLFRRHVHAITATLWILILVLQPWIYNNKSTRYHRKLGFVGLFLAGGVVFTALALLPFNGPAYGITFSNLVQLAGFSFSVILAMFNSRDYKKHARWMISSIFWIFPPATSRLIGFIMWSLNDYEGSMWRIEAWYASLFTVIIPLSIMMYIDYRKEKVIYRAYLIPAIAAFPIILLNPILQESEWWVNFCKTVIGQGV